MELESRYVIARLRAVEERIASLAQEVEDDSVDGREGVSGEYLAGYGRGLLEARDHVRRLRRALADIYPVE